MSKPVKSSSKSMSQTEKVSYYDESNLLNSKLTGPIEPSPPVISKIWIAYAFGAATCFTIVNNMLTEVISNVGPLSIFYFASGSIFIGVVFNFYKACTNYRENGVFW